MKTKILITLTDEQHTIAKRQSISLFGYENVSGMIAYWITNYIPAGPPTLKSIVLEAPEAPQSTIKVESMITKVDNNNVYDVRFISNNYKDKMMQIGTWTKTEPILFRAEKLEVGDKITVTKHKKE